MGFLGAIEFVIMSDSTAKIEIHFDVETQMQMKILIGLLNI